MFTKGYCFDDVLLIPKHSKIESRSLVDTSVDLPRGISLSIPIVSANMKTVTGVKMAQTIKALGGLAILHRFGEYDDLVQDFITANIPQNTPGAIGASVGIKPKDLKQVNALHRVGCKIICIDVAHGDHSAVAEFVTAMNLVIGFLIFVLLLVMLLQILELTSFGRLELIYIRAWYWSWFNLYNKN